MRRLFTALTLPEEISETLGLMVPQIAGIRPVPEEAIHLTLRFIGEVEQKNSVEVEECLALVEAPILKLKLRGVGVFPEGKNPRVLFAGVAENRELSELKKNIDRELRSIGFENDARPYRPHVTLARLPHPLPDTAAEKIISFLKEFGSFESEPFTCDEFVLFQSRLHEDGARYSASGTYLLGNLTDFLLN
ncbi:MAG: RNA 2',3'-cyclic phosphodiesterase [Spirochaetia bacterium]|nr:RNA 2',3'-cyclic phosphodiesterase [Spirochaetia bacterium]